MFYATLLLQKMDEKPC